MAERTEERPIAKLVLDPRMQPRAESELDTHHIDRMLPAIDKIAREHPITVYRLTQPFEKLKRGAEVVAGGFHRIALFEKAGRATIPCEIIEGTWEQCFLHSRGENLDHGKLMTANDTRHAAFQAFEERKKLGLSFTDMALADKLQKGRSWISELRREWEAMYASVQGGANGSAETDPEPDADKGADDAIDDAFPPPASAHENPVLKALRERGFVSDAAYKEALSLPPNQAGMFVARRREGYSDEQALESAKKGGRRNGRPAGPVIGEADLSGPASPPPPNGRAPGGGRNGKAQPRGPLRDAAGAEVPDRLRDAFADPSLRDLAAELEAAGVALRADPWSKKAERLAVHYPFVLVEKFREHAAEAERRLLLALEAVRAGIPHAVCPRCRGEEPAPGKTCRHCRGSGLVPEHRYEEMRRDAV